MNRAPAVKVVTDPVAVRILTDPERRRYLATFMEDQITLGEAANHLEVKLNNMTYHVNKLIELSLIEIVGSKRHRGHTRKLYKTTAEAFFVPYEATPYASLKALIQNAFRDTKEMFVENLARTFLKEAEHWGLNISRQPTGGVLVVMSPNPSTRNQAEEKLRTDDSSAVWVSDAVTSLDLATAKELQRELYGLLQKYVRKPNDKTQKYLISLGLTPIQSE